MLSKLSFLMVILLVGLTCALPGCKHKRTPASVKPPAAKKDVKREDPSKKEAKAETPAKKPVSRDVATWEVQGWGRTREEATEDAQKRALARVADYLKQKRPSRQWRPTVEFVRDHLQEGEAIRNEAEDKDIPLDNGEKIRAQCWTITVRVTSAALAAMTQMEAQERALQARRERAVVTGDRMLLLAKVLAGIVGGLIALLVNIRIDDLTKGYYSGWLKAGTVAFLAVVGAGVWLCC
jgi:hypothetical protein